MNARLFSMGRNSGQSYKRPQSSNSECCQKSDRYYCEQKDQFQHPRNNSTVLRWYSTQKASISNTCFKSIYPVPSHNRNADQKLSEWSAAGSWGSR